MLRETTKKAVVLIGHIKYKAEHESERFLKALQDNPASDLSNSGMD